MTELEMRDALEGALMWDRKRKAKCAVVGLSKFQEDIYVVEYVEVELIKFDGVETVCNYYDEFRIEDIHRDLELYTGQDQANA